MSHTPAWPPPSDGSSPPPRCHRIDEVFRRFANRTAAAVGSKYAFALAIFIVLIWATLGPHYHQPTDTPERVDYRKLQRVSVWVRDLLRRLADDAEAPAWAPQDVTRDLEEMRTVAVLVRRVLDRPDVYPLSEKDRALVEGVERRLAAILRRGEVSGLDRVWLVLTARLLMETVF